MSTSSPRSLRDRLNRYAFALACVVSVVVGALLIFLDRKLTFDQAFSAIGLNLLSAIVFAVIFSTLSTRTQERNILETLDERFDKQDALIAQQMHMISTQFLPSKLYQAVPDFNEEFNRDISASLARSKVYWFRGTSAKYVPARIRRCKSRPDKLQIVMLDPGNENAVRRRAVDRQLQAKLQTKSVEDLMNETKDEIYMSLVALFDIRDFCPVEVLLIDEPIITRMELFDDSVYLSWYQGPSSPTSPFPETIRFNAGSFIYATERLGIVKSFDISSRLVRFEAGKTDSDLIACISEISHAETTSAAITQWRTQYKQFIAPFDDWLKQL